MCGGRGELRCVFAQLFPPIILLETNLSAYLNRIIVQLFLGSLKDFNVHLCIIHKISRHTDKIHRHIEPQTMQIICKL